MDRDDRPFELSYPLGFLARAAALSALACAVGLAILRWVFSRDLGSEFAPAFYMLRNLIHFLVPALVFCLLAALLVASVALFAVAVFASHKVAGPLFRLQRVAGYLGRGTLIGRIHLRSGDQGKPVATSINDWMDRRKGRLAALRVGADEIDTALSACELDAGRADRESMNALLSELASTVGALKAK
ncbi:MAG: hypothetical protein HZB55_06765 [Deltaproteobacteria bacterium]|nr:hypothetical protein [Deltaproteobacteria bacterium]